MRTRPPLALLSWLALLASACMARDGQPRRAAAITYADIARPEALPADFAGSAAVDLRFLQLAALDGNVVPAALWQPRGRSPGDTPLVIDVHGSARSYEAAPNGPLARDLSARGYAVLGINTRQARERTNSDNFMAIRGDIEAAVFTARALGYRTLVLHGHSLGNIHVQLYAATNWAPDLKAVILTGMFADLPHKSRHVLMQDDAQWLALQREALAALRDGEPERVLATPMRWINGVGVQVTARHFLTYRAQESSAAVGTYWIRRVPYPVLLVRDAGDTIVAESEAAALEAAARSEGSLVPSVTRVELPNATAGRDAHYFVNNAGPLAATVADWLAAHAIR